MSFRFELPSEIDLKKNLSGSKRFLLVTSFLIALLLLFSACSDTTNPNERIEPGLQGLYILSEGLWGSPSTSELSVITSDTSAVRDVYQNLAQEYLGDVPNHLTTYNNRLYIVVNNSHLIRVIDLVEMMKVDDIELPAKSPREMIIIDGTGYVSCYDSTLTRIDLDTNTPDDVLLIGSKPEGLAYANGRIFVACGGWGTDNRIFVIDHADFKIDTVLIAENNVVALAANEMRLYAGSYPDWSAGVMDPKLLAYNLTTLQIVDSIRVMGGVGQLILRADELFVKNNDIYKINASSFAGTFIKLVSELDYTVYGIYIDNDANLWSAEYLSNDFTQPGRVVKRDLSGTIQRFYEVGIGPKAMLKIGE